MIPPPTPDTTYDECERMLYDTYQAQRDLTEPFLTLAGASARALRALPPSLAETVGVRHLSAAYEVLSRARLTHERPPFGIDSVVVRGRSVAVHEEVTTATPFCSLVHFAKEIDGPGPPVLLIAPLSGHFATLLREAASTMLREFDVYITDWHNARDMPVAAGRFGLDEYIDHVIGFVETIGPHVHVLAVCQPCVPALAATALMSTDRHAAVPKSLTLMAGPIDTRVNPTRVNELASNQSLEWFERMLITEVPGRYAGARRRVYPGFLQLGAFMGMNPDRHARSHFQLFTDLSTGEFERAAVTESFYDEYFAVMDLPAEFYLETVQRVFQEHDLARGTLVSHDRVVDPKSIRRTALLTVEGARDDICAPGQTLAAHDLCTAIPPARRRQHLQAGVGHYGLFSGRRWQQQVYPVVRSFIRAND